MLCPMYVRAFILHYFHRTFYSVLESLLQLHSRGLFPFLVGGINIDIINRSYRLMFSYHWNYNNMWGRLRFHTTLARAEQLWNLG